MSLQARWRSWTGLPTEVRWMLVEAVITLACTRLLVAFGLRWCALWMFRTAPESARPPLELERHLRFSLRLAALRAPWKSVCLPTAMAGKLMLHRRGWPSTIHLGAGKHASGELHAHAWLEAGGWVITGEAGRKFVVPLEITPSLTRPC